jgi:hypothetical protein
MNATRPNSTSALSVRLDMHRAHLCELDRKATVRASLRRSGLSRYGVDSRLWVCDPQHPGRLVRRPA